MNSFVEGFAVGVGITNIIWLFVREMLQDRKSHKDFMKRMENWK